MYHTEVKRENKCYGSIIYQMPTEVEAIAEQQMGRQPFGGMIRVDEFPALDILAPTETYEGDNWSATRRRIDQLDNVTFSRIRR